jgi:FOG: TPR repeat
VPFFLLVLDYWPLGRVQWTDTVAPKKNKRATHTVPTERKSNVIKLIVEKIPLFALVLASSVVTFIAQHQGKATLMNEVISFRFRFANALVSYVAYLGKMLWPSDLSVLYPYRFNITTVQWVGALVIVAAVSVLVFWMGRRLRYLAVGWLWYMGTLVPVIGLIQVGEQSMADRYTYIPLIGIFIAIVWGVGELTAGWRYSRVCCAIAAGAVSLGCMAGTRVQVGYWQNNITLFQHALDVTTNNTAAHIYLGKSLELLGHMDEAITRYEQALKIRPHQPMALAQLSSALCKQGKLDEAANILNEALSINPEDADAHSNLGFVLTHQGRLEEAIGHLHEALRLDPQHTEAHNNLGTALDRQGKLSEAIGHFRAVLTIDPKHRAALNNVGIIWIKQGKLDEAAAHFRGVLKLNPDYAEAHSNLAIILATQGKIDEAIAQFREVVRIEPAYPEAQQRLDILLTQQAGRGSQK